MKISYAIVFVRDMQRSVAFYRDDLGLRLRFESSHWSELEAGGVTLAIHLAEGPGAPVESGSEQPGTCRPGFAVLDLDEFHRRITERGVMCLQEPRDVFGSRVALYRDPDGLAFSVGEERDQQARPDVPEPRRASE